jgi:pimeloyl-[acyl-carrier protein] methyl ester esterase
MHIETQGEGPDLVLIHGWAMHGGIFAPLTDLLVAHFRVHLVDLPGHGYSRDETQFEIGDCARTIAAATPRALWVGWSLGGLVAMCAALDQSPSVRGLGMLAASPRFVGAAGWPHGVDASVFAAFDAELRSRYGRAIERFLALETMGSENPQAELRDLKQRVFARGEPAVDALAAGLRALETCDLRAQVASLSMPSVWIAGRRDRLVPAAAMQWSAAHALTSRYLECNSGHAPFLSHAQDVADALVAFAAELPA